MKTYRTNAVMAGALYILGTVARILSVVTVGGFPDEDLLSRMAAVHKRFLAVHPLGRITRRSPIPAATGARESFPHYARGTQQGASWRFRYGFGIQTCNRWVLGSNPIPAS
jgi:hypothetical protein